MWFMMWRMKLDGGIFNGRVWKRQATGDGLGV